MIYFNTFFLGGGGGGGASTYINTNEIPGELLRKNMLNIYLHRWKDHLCYGYMLNNAFHSKKL